VSEPGTAQWRRAEASRLVTFARAAALPDGGFGWLGVNGEIDVTQPRPLYINSRMTYAFALAHLAGVAGAESMTFPDRSMAENQPPFSPSAYWLARA
jgi:sulfoquinovose isomerase